MPGRFFDTNVVVYQFSDGPRADVARTVLSEGGVISVQVLNEFLSVARGKMKLGWIAWDEILTDLRELLTIVPVTESVHDTGRWILERYKFSVYDSMIVGAALVAGCDTLLTEDLQDGMLIDGRLRVVNPFGA